MKHLFLEKEKNINWKGGRTISSHGYVLIKVGYDHHLADKNGYAYEHRLVAENKIGRKLKKGELVHHINKNKLDNSKKNIEVKRSAKDHLFNHRKVGSKRKLPNETNYIIHCKCGCGKSFYRYDENDRPRSYISGHNIIKKHYYCKCGCQNETHNKNKKYIKGHRPNRFGKRKIDKSPKILCACGCTNMIYKFDKYGRIKKFTSGHNNRIQTIS